MGFGKNPHVAKAEAAEQKAQVAKDEIAREQAWREAARLWDRAADRESDDKRRQSYTERADQARAQADEPDGPAADSGDEAKPVKPTLLN